MRIRETIVVEGRNDTAAIKRAVDAHTIETHGFGIARETWKLLEKAYQETGMIIFTDPDFAGEEIRRRLTKRFPKAAQAHLSQGDAIKAGDVGIENASPETICRALAHIHCTTEEKRDEFTMADLQRQRLTGVPEAAQRRDCLGKLLGIGYGNSKTFLSKLNQYGITREEFLLRLGEI